MASKIINKNEAISIKIASFLFILIKLNKLFCPDRNLAGTLVSIIIDDTI